MWILDYKWGSVPRILVLPTVTCTSFLPGLSNHLLLGSVTC